MQLLLRRQIREPLGAVRFVLWAKFEVGSDEARLLNRYHAAAGYLTIEQNRRDFWRAIVISFFIALLATGLIVGTTQNLTMATPTGYVPRPVAIPPVVYFFVFVGVFLLATWLLYEMIREAIKIGDMLEGREFKHKSLVLMARRERRLIGYAHAFVQFLEKLKEWEGTEIIEIGEDDHDRALRLVTDTYAPA